MPSTRLNLREDDVVRLTLEFLSNRELHITQLSMERETGVINGNFADDVLFLRQLILDGQWDDVIEFIQPLQTLQTFDSKKFEYIILRHKYIELLCMKSEFKAYNVQKIINDIVEVLTKIQELSPTKEEYSYLCLLLSLPNITEHAKYRNWNPSNARVQCFREILPLVEQFLPCERKSSKGTPTKCARNDRLMQLLIKGILYESCVNYCQAKATGYNMAQFDEGNFSKLLDANRNEESDLSLLSWLQSIPADTFSVPFEQRTLHVDVERLEKPSLHTSWSEHMLVTPIKPQTFPHLAMPFRRPKSAADVMTRSLRPVPDGVPRHPAIMTLSAIDCPPSSSCMPGFHLSSDKGNKLMTTSVDKLFESTDSPAPIILPPMPVLNENQCQNSNNDVETAVETYSKTKPPTKMLEDMQIKADEVMTTTFQDMHSLTKSDIKESSKNNESYENRKYEQVKEALPMQHEKNAYYPPPVGSEYIENATQDQGPTSEHSKKPIPEGDFRRELLKKFQQQKEKECKDYILNLSRRRKYIAEEENIEPDQSANNVRQATDGAASSGQGNGTTGRPAFKRVTVLEDAQAIRCVEFHPKGKYYAVGSNSKTLRICKYPDLDDFSENTGPTAPFVLFKRTRHHKGSIYCLAWNPTGDLLATGSNDKSVKIMRFNSNTCNLEGSELELTMHDGTIRDICFLEDSLNKARLLLSAGAGDCKIYVTDCGSGVPYQALSGHSAPILSLYHWGGAMFASSSQDKTVRIWDLRSANCVNIVTPGTGSYKSTAVTSLAVDPSDRLMVFGHEDGTCGLYDVRGSRDLQRFQPHTADVRSVRFSPGAYYLLTAGYDAQVILTDLQGDLTCNLPSVNVASHVDKVITARWHPEDFSFLSTSADKTAVLWAIPTM